MKSSLPRHCKNKNFSLVNNDKNEIIFIAFVSHIQVDQIIYYLKL